MLKREKRNVAIDRREGEVYSGLYPCFYFKKEDITAGNSWEQNRVLSIGKCSRHTLARPKDPFSDQKYKYIQKRYLKWHLQA